MARRVGFDNEKPVAKLQESVWAPFMAKGEEILWEGRPGFGFSPSFSALKAFGIVAVAVAVLLPQFITLQISSDISKQALLADMGTIPLTGTSISPFIFLAVAMAWTILWFLWQTVSTPWAAQYMLSNRRAYIRKTLAFRRVKAYILGLSTTIEYDGLPNGTINFASEVRRADRGKKRDFPVGFKNIDGAHKVYLMMLDVQENMVRPPAMPQTQNRAMS